MGFLPPDPNRLPRKKRDNKMGAKRKARVFPPAIRSMLKSANAPLYGGVLNETTVTAKAPNAAERFVAKEFSKELNSFPANWPKDKAYLNVNLYTAGEKTRKKAKGNVGVFSAGVAGEKLVKEKKKRVKRGQSFRYGK